MGSGNLFHHNPVLSSLKLSYFWDTFGGNQLAIKMQCIPGGYNEKKDNNHVNNSFGVPVPVLRAFIR
jgi:hypothetical protein